MEEPIRGSRIRAIEQSLLCDSQHRESSSSTLPFTDPPDIRNWHSSYVYESPVLDSFLAFEYSKKKEDDSANNLSSLATAIDYQKDSPSTKVPDSLQSELQLSGFSDPPDIRNWHSSYVYESPVLDSVFAFKDSNKKEDDSANNLSSLATGFDNHKDRPSTKVADSLQSELQLSGFSDPPDIRNWHSSYVYESPELSWDLRYADEIKAAEQPYNDASVGNGIDEHQIQSLSKIAASSEPLSQFSEPPHISNWHSSYVYESPQLSILDEIPQSWYKDKKSRQDGSTDSILEEPHRDNIGNNNACISLPPNKENDELIKTELISGKDQKDQVFTDHDKNLLETEQHMSIPGPLLFKQPVKQQTFEGLGKENEGRDIDSSGFVSIKKRRANEDICSRKSDRGLKKCSNGEEHVLSMNRGNRKALAETTNVYACSESIVSGSTGKWKCPQRSKPSVGPPLKQLRLEKWVNLVRK